MDSIFKTELRRSSGVVCSTVLLPQIIVKRVRASGLPELCLPLHGRGYGDTSGAERAEMRWQGWIGSNRPRPVLRTRVIGLADFGSMPTGLSFMERPGFICL